MKCCRVLRHLPAVHWVPTVKKLLFKAAAFSVGRLTEASSGCGQRDSGGCTPVWNDPYPTQLSKEYKDNARSSRNQIAFQLNHWSPPRRTTLFLIQLSKSEMLPHVSDAAHVPLATDDVDIPTNDIFRHDPSHWLR